MLVLSQGGPAVKILILQHIACEPPGVYEDILVERGAAIHRVESTRRSNFPIGRVAMPFLQWAAP